MKPASPKVHVAINQEPFSTCGLSPHKGNHDIRTMVTFFQVEEGDQCVRCLMNLIAHGYSIKKLRATAKLVSRQDVVVDRDKMMRHPWRAPWHTVHLMDDGRES